MTVPKYHELIRPLLDLVADGRPRNLREAAQELAERLSLTDEDLTETLPSGYPRYLNRVGWAKSDLNKTGLIESCGRGLFRISERGSNALPELPPQLDRKYFEARELGSWKSVSAPPTSSAGSSSTASTCRRSAWRMRPWAARTSTDSSAHSQSMEPTAAFSSPPVDSRKTQGVRSNCPTFGSS